MIKINLLKNASDKPARRLALPVKAVVTGIVFVTVLIAVGGGAFLFRWWLRLPRPPKAMETATVTMEGKAASDKSFTVASADAFTPSTHGTSKMVEDVVDEIDAKQNNGKASGLVGLRYREMSRGEQINYEVLYTRNIVQVLSRLVPDGIGFNSLTIDSFTTISAAGLGATREQVGSLFAALRRERFDLLEPPRSYIKPSGGGYRFFFTCEPSFGINAAEPFQATDRIESRQQLSSVQKNFSSLAARDAVVLRGGLKHTATDKWGEYLRFAYHISGRTTYRNFVKFVLELYDARVACSFCRVRLTARSDSAIDIDADVVFTLRE